MLGRTTAKTHTGKARILAWTAFTAIALVALVDAGSIVITRTQTKESAREAGFAAGHAVRELQQVNEAAAVTAYNAALTVAEPNETILKSDFLVRNDKAVSLTVRRTAPTLLAGHIPGLAEWTRVDATYLQYPIGF